jgi:aspartyl-tRNA(Asn)/glutamyl-tRNA(Gln) amidotransferase subunit C
MTLSLEEVKHIAELANLALTEEQAKRYQEQLSAILEYADQIQAVDTDDISPTATVSPLRSVMRDDVAGEPLDREAALANAPNALANCFFVPAIFEEE